MTEPETSKFGLSETRIFTELALERGYVNQAQVDECLDIREKIRAMGLNEKLPEIMVKKGYLAEADARRLERALSGYRRLGNFEIVARIGQGSMGAVFKARQVSMDRYVAVKILPPKLAKDASYVDRFMREARAVAKLNHVNIVQGIDVGEESGYYYFAMEYVEGVTVRETLKSKGPYPEKAALEIIIQIARALDHAAKVGLVHRDIKPDNIIVTPAGVAKLLDLGIAKTAEAADESGERVGTPYYISPEQARGDADVDARSDLYSLGATFYHMVVGSPPFTGSSPEEIIRAHLTATVPNPREVRPGLSRNVSRVIEMMMAREPADRYQSAAELLADLDKVARGLPPGKAKAFRGQSSVEIGPETGTAMTHPLPPVSRRPMAILIGSVAAAAVILAAGIGVALALRKPPAPPPPIPVPAPAPTPAPTPGPDPRSANAKEMLAYALKKISEHPGELEANLKLLEQVVADTRGTAAGLEAQGELDKLRRQFEAAIQKSWEAAWLTAEAKAKERRYADAVSALDAGFPGRYRQNYPPWASRYRLTVKDLEDQAARWIDGEEKRAAELVGKHEFDKARQAVRAIAVAGTAGISERVAGALSGIDKAEADYKKLLADQQLQQQEELRRQRELAYGRFLRELYGKHPAKGFDSAEEFCGQAAGSPAYAAAKPDLEAEAKDLAEVRRAAGELLDYLGALRGTIRFTWNNQPMSAKIIGKKDDRVWVSPGEGAEMPITPAEMVAAEVVELTAFGRDSPANAARAALYLTWRADYSAARKYAEAMAAGPQRDRAVKRLDLLEKGMAEFYADEAVRKARAAHAAGNFAAFNQLMAELRAKHAGTRAWTAAQAELEKLELDAALAGLDPAMLALGTVKAAPGALAFSYDFRVESPQVLDWQSTGDMWRWGQTIFDRNGVDLFLGDEGRLTLRPEGDRRLAANWAVPVGKFSSVELEAAWLNGRGSLGLGLAKGDLFAKDGNLRAWFPEDGKPYIRQGDQRKQADNKLTLEKGRKYRVRLEVVGNEVRLLLDGKELVRDALKFDPAGSRLALGAWATETAFGSLQVACQPEDSWLRRRAELAAKFRQAGVKPGLNAEYFGDQELKKSMVKRVEQGAHYWWNLRAPAPGVPPDNFSARLAGKLYVEKAGRYKLYLRPDDRGALYLDGTKVIECGFQGSAEAPLKAGFHDLEMVMAEGGGFAGIELSWETDGLERQVVPFELLGH